MTAHRSLLFLLPCILALRRFESKRRKEESPMEWTEIIMKVPSAQLEQAADMAQMAVDGGIYVEDYSHLEEEAREIAHIDLIDEELLAKDREHGLVHLYISPEENPKEALAFLRERCAGEGIDCEFSVESCAEEDWINNWKQYFHPIPVG